MCAKIYSTFKNGEDYVNIDFNGIKRSIPSLEFVENTNIKLSEGKFTKGSFLIGMTEIRSNRFYLYTNNNGELYVTTRINRYCKVRQKLRCKITDKYIYFYGYLTDVSDRIENFDKILLNAEVVGKIERPFEGVKKLKHLMVAKVKISDVIDSGNIHNNIRIGQREEISVPILMDIKHEGMNYWARRKVGDNLILIRSIINGNKIRITNIKFNPEYKRINLIKNSIAFNLSKILGNKKINLMFEKETSRACESGYYSFEKIIDKQINGNLDSRTYFVIDKDSDDYNMVKSKYGKHIIDKYSFKHYLYIYLCKYFISSEFSPHVINPRLYITSLSQCIAKKPLIFLQHGIMFSKPVDNPAASNFRKDNLVVNFYKNVVSSDLEATQFYKCGFDDDDLIKCGLPKFDVSKMNDDADKIMVMLTYRYWEESFVMDEEKIKETTYYQAYMRILEAFEENGLLDRLIISCHPKFTDYLSNLNPKYAKCVENDIAKALAESKIYITDYSSASYDAHYRGAYIIYNWEERDYLIERYKAIPPIDETNCDGVPVFSMDQLIDEVKRAIENDYVMDEIYEERYRKINEFHDGKNGDRLVEELLRLDVI